MPYLTASLQAYGSPQFEATLKRELAGLEPDALRLQQGLRSGSFSHGSNLGVMILGVAETPQTIDVRAGVFFTSTLSGCACTDDPTPADSYPEYHEIELSIDRRTGKAEVRATEHP